MLDFIYYPVSFILWCWHTVFGFVFGEASAVSWVLGIMFLTFTVRAIMFKPFVNQVRSMRKMQEFAPEIKKLQKKYANDKQKLAQEMQRLQSQHGVNPLGGCLPMLLQIPVFIGLNWVLRAFTYNPNPGTPKTENYFFDQAGVESYVNAKLFGVNIGDAIHHAEMMGGTGGGWNWQVAPVAIPLMIVASIATHLTARHSVARQNPASMTPQTGMMNKITMYVFPLGVLVFGAFFPIGLLIYWLSNNAWTLMQQHLVYKKIDQEEEDKKTAAVQKRSALGPKVGQKPTSTKKRPAQTKDSSAETSADAADDKASPEAASGNDDKPGTTGKSKPTGGASTSKAKPARTASSSNGSGAKKTTEGSGEKSANGGAEIPGLVSDRSRSKKSGRKRS